MDIISGLEKTIEEVIEGIEDRIHPLQTLPDDHVNEPIEPVNRKVLLIVFDPLIPSERGRRLSYVMGWNDVGQLASGFIDDLRKASYGYANYEVAIRFDVDQFPVKKDGFVYDADEFVDSLRSGDSSRFHQPDLANYRLIAKSYDLVGRIDRNEIDEVWLFGFPYSGFFESCMAGPGAFWCNGPILAGTKRCSRRFVVMGFNFERGVGEMLEAFSHRAESIMDYVFRDQHGEDNLYKRYIRYDKLFPGKAEIGTVHYAPNSERDYDWGNQSKVMTRCRNWEKFPDLSGEPVELDCAEWGSGDIREHHRWWLGHMPHLSGEYEGISYNWWKYIVDPNLVK